MRLKKLLSIILSPLVLGSYSASAVGKIPNMVKDRVLKRENRNLSPKRKRSRRKKNKVVNHKVDKKKLRNRTRDKSPIVSFRDSFIKGSKRVGRFIKENPGKSALITTAAVCISNRFMDYFADDDEIFNRICEEFIQEKLNSINNIWRTHIGRYFDAYENIHVNKYSSGSDLYKDNVAKYNEDKTKADFIDKLLKSNNIEYDIDSECVDSNGKLEDLINRLRRDDIFVKEFGSLKGQEYFSKIGLVMHLVHELHKVDKETYSIPHTVLRRLWDFFLMRGATTRQRKSAERILYNGKAEGYGSCWELANIVDWFCRKFGFERHNIIAYKLGPGIYHTFNFFVCKGKAYLADPLGGVIQVLELENGSLLKALENFRGSQLLNGIVPGYGDWYAVEQIEDNTCRTLGMMKLARFFPNISDGSHLFKPHENCNIPNCTEHYECNIDINTEKFDTIDKSSFITKTSDGKLVLNDKANIKFDSFSSLVYG